MKAHKTVTEQKLRSINAKLKDSKNRKNQKIRSELGDEKERYE